MWELASGVWTLKRDVWDPSPHWIKPQVNLTPFNLFSEGSCYHILDMTKYFHGLKYESNLPSWAKFDYLTEDWKVSWSFALRLDVCRPLINCSFNSIFLVTSVAVRRRRSAKYVKLLAWSPALWICLCCCCCCCSCGCYWRLAASSSHGHQHATSPPPAPSDNLT